MKKTIVVISKTTQKKLCETIEKYGFQSLVLNPSETYLFISQSENGYDRVYSGGSVKSEPTRLLSKDVVAVIPRVSGEGFEFGCAVVRHFEKCLGIYSTASALGMKTASDKFWTSQNLSEAGLPQPKTILTNIPRHAGFLIDKVGGLPTVGKATRGSQGKAVFIMETPLAANTTLQTFLNGKAESIIIQQFIESSANNKAVHDIRAIVVGDSVVSAMERTGTNGLHANLSQGGTGRDVLSELTDREKELCVKAAKAVHLDFAGVDFIRNANDSTQSFWIEVNSNSGEGIIGITGKNHYEDLLNLIVDKTTKNISETDTSPKSTTLTGEQMLSMAKQGNQSKEVLEGAIAYLSKLNNNTPDELAMSQMFKNWLFKR